MFARSVAMFKVKLWCRLIGLTTSSGQKTRKTCKAAVDRQSAGARAMMSNQIEVLLGAMFTSEETPDGLFQRSEAVPGSSPRRSKS